MKTLSISADNRRFTGSILYAMAILRTSAPLLAAALLLLTASASRADETFPVVHDEPITVRVLDGLNGKPLVHAHLLLIAGYDKEQLKMQTWREEALTDANGKAVLSKQLDNLPFLQVWVLKEKTCQSNPRSDVFSIDRIRRDGLSTPNLCGITSVENTPGSFTVFIKSKKPKKPKAPSMTQPVHVLAKAAVSVGPLTQPAPTATSAPAPVPPAAAVILTAPAAAPAPDPAPPAVSAVPATPAKTAPPVAATPATAPASAPPTAQLAPAVTPALVKGAMPAAAAPTAIPPVPVAAVKPAAIPAVATPATAATLPNPAVPPAAPAKTVETPSATLRKPLSKPAAGVVAPAASALARPASIAPATPDSASTLTPDPRPAHPSGRPLRHPLPPQHHAHTVPNRSRAVVPAKPAAAPTPAAPKQ